MGMISNIVLLGRVYYLGRISLGGPLHTTHTHASPFSSRVRRHSLLADAIIHRLLAKLSPIWVVKHIYTIKNNEKFIRAFHQTLGVQNIKH